MKKSTLVILFIIFALIGVLIYFMPNIYKKIQDIETPKVEKIEKHKDDLEKVKPITMESDVIKELIYPIMHNNKYNTTSYFQKDIITINDFSNNDILYNAFLHLYEGYLTEHKSIGCTNESKEFDANYLKSRIKNIIGKDISYNLEDFTVPEINLDNKYIGLWKYDINENKYIYYGNCNKENNNTIYYELTDLYKVESKKENSELELYYHIGFVKQENNNYTVYKNPDFKEELLNGTKINPNDTIKLDYNNLNTYKYTFKLGICSYDNYCFYKGEWINAR